jgi:hypothetical protein
MQCCFTIAISSLRPSSRVLRSLQIIISIPILQHHCGKSIELLKNSRSRSKINILNHHPDYLADFREVKRTDARNKLKLKDADFIILNFGNQKKYKNEDFIETVFKQIPLKNKFLLTAGDFIYDGYKGLSLFKLKIRNK